MRVLSVGNMYPPHRFGGHEQVWRTAVMHLRKRGHDVRVLTTDTRTGGSTPDTYRELYWHLRDGELGPPSLRQRVWLARHDHRVVRAVRHTEDVLDEVVAASASAPADGMTSARMPA